MGALDIGGDGPQFYRPSGRGAGAGAITVVVAAFVATLVLAPIYVYGTIYIPFIYLNALLAVGYGGSVGLAAGAGARWGKVRSPLFVTIAGGLMGLNAAYSAWVYWVFVQSNHEVWVFGLGGMTEVWTQVMDIGTWGFRSGGNVTGIFLAGIWVIEAALLVGLSAAGARLMLGRTPFCEDCNAWPSAHDERALLVAPRSLGTAGLTKELRRGNWAVLHGVEQGRLSLRKFLELERWTCTRCGDFDVMTLKEVQLRKDKDGDDKRDETVLLDRLLLGPEGGRAYDALGSEPEEADAGAQGAEETGEETGEDADAGDRA